jgi:hypothetical protein
MDMFDRLREFYFMVPSMEYGNLVSPADKTVDKIRARRAGSADNKCFH